VNEDEFTFKMTKSGYSLKHIQFSMKLTDKNLR